MQRLNLLKPVRKLADIEAVLITGNGMDRKKVMSS
jgi:hypothetical protein